LQTSFPVKSGKDVSNESLFISTTHHPKTQINMQRLLTGLSRIILAGNGRPPCCFILLKHLLFKRWHHLALAQEQCLYFLLLWHLGQFFPEMPQIKPLLLYKIPL
jgi:hypothetical protein